MPGNSTVSDLNGFALTHVKHIEMISRRQKITFSYPGFNARQSRSRLCDTMFTGLQDNTAPHPALPSIFLTFHGNSSFGNYSAPIPEDGLENDRVNETRLQTVSDGSKVLRHRSTNASLRMLMRLVAIFSHRMLNRHICLSQPMQRSTTFRPQNEDLLNARRPSRRG